MVQITEKRCQPDLIPYYLLLTKIRSLSVKFVIFLFTFVGLLVRSFTLSWSWVWVSEKLDTKFKSVSFLLFFSSRGLVNANFVIKSSGIQWEALEQDKICIFTVFFEGSD
jgi:hypothetical protein